jgi:DNA invertase Pin-like site-specific DNA recombinase
MASSAPKPIRCAIYTRKSTDHGLELEFNSLDAQREACEAYIKSQASQGWRALPQHYDDPAYSGGNLDRPALKQLLKDIDAGQVDVVVVYKIDRLTRSLADFAKLVEQFDARAISFVAVTQQFNTTSSMGRLTLNVLLSFAQFERELSSERVRDKIAASRRKGKWTGGNIPLGYDTVDKKLVINAKEAKTVRAIFDRYLELQSFGRLVEDLDAKGIVSKSRHSKAPKFQGGIPFTYGPLAYLLKNRIYLGEVRHNNKWFAGEHPPIIPRDIFDQVQDLLQRNAIDRKNRRSASGALLMGKLYDDRGNCMTPSYTTKNSVRYPFYISTAHLRGRRAEAGSVSRIAAQEIEAPVLVAVKQRLEEQHHTFNEQSIADYVTRAVIAERHITITMADLSDGSYESTANETIKIPWQRRPRGSRAHLEGEHESTEDHNEALIQSIVRAHAWLRSLTNGTFENIESLAKASGRHSKIIRQGLRLAFLPPKITEAILEGRQLSTLALADLYQARALSWARVEDAESKHAQTRISFTTKNRKEQQPNAKR